MNTVWQDLRYGARMLLKNPGSPAVAVVTLALGIGANTAIFTLLDQVLLRLLPVKDPKRLVLLTMCGRHYGNNWGGNAISLPMFRDFQNHNEVFSGMFCRFPVEASVTFRGNAERVQTELVSGTYFDVLGVGPALGRTLMPEDDRVPGGHPVVVLSYTYWKTQFSGDPRVVRKTLLAHPPTFTIVAFPQAGFARPHPGHPAN